VSESSSPVSGEDCCSGEKGNRWKSCTNSSL